MNILYFLIFLPNNEAERVVKMFLPKNEARVLINCVLINKKTCSPVPVLK